MYGLIPLPARIIEGEGRLCLGPSLEVRAPESLAGERAVLAAWLARALPALVVTEVEHGAAPARACVRLELDPSLAARESYSLHIAADGITLAAADGAGITRGSATLWQLALSEGKNLPCLDIRDEPRYAWRGFMLDTARSFYRVDFLEKLLDLAAMHKLNVFHWHLSDDQAWRLDVPGKPELAMFGSRRLDKRYHAVRYREGTYSEADVRRIVAFASARHIEVIPEIDVPGHSTALLASHPELWCHGDHDSRRFEPEDRFGVFDGVLCAGNDASLDLLGSVFDYLASVFPSRFVHAGGDEVLHANWLSCERCRRRMTVEDLRDRGGALDPERLHAWFMDKLAKTLSGLSRRMICWDEVVDGACGKDVLVMAWRSQEHGCHAAELGYDVVMCPQTAACYLDHKHRDEFEEPGQLGVCTVKDSYLFDPAPPVLSDAARGRILGGQANLWSELLYFGRQAEYMLYPRLSAIAEALWTPPARKDFADFSARMTVHGPRLDTLGVNRYRGLLE